MECYKYNVLTVTESNLRLIGRNYESRSILCTFIFGTKESLLKISLLLVHGCNVLHCNALSNLVLYIFPMTGNPHTNYNLDFTDI